MKLVLVSCVLSYWLSSIGVPSLASEWNPESADVLLMSNRDGNSEVYLWRAVDGSFVNLTRNAAIDNWPVWSPDGRHIVFQSNRMGNLDIWVMGSDGAEPRQLTDDPEPDYLPAWSPDGRFLIFTSWRLEEGDHERAPHIYIMHADGTGQRRLIEHSLGSSSGASWAPNGREIVYTRKVGEGADLFIAASTGGEEKQITHDHERNIYNGAAEFSPDGRLIAFYSSDGSSSSLEIIDAEGRNRRTVLGKGNNWYPRWSPDGRWLIYCAATAEGDDRDIDIFAIRVSGEGKPVKLIDGSELRGLERLGGKSHW
jgi:TolB protein